MLDHGPQECDYECSKKRVLRGDQQSLHKRDVATQMGKAKLRTVQSDKNGVFVMCANHDIPEIHAKLHMKGMYDERHKHEYHEVLIQACHEDLQIRRRTCPHARNHETVVEQKLYSGVDVENHMQITQNLLVKSHSATCTQLWFTSWLEWHNVWLNN